jgi:hypothetical protein
MKKLTLLTLAAAIASLASVAAQDGPANTSPVTRLDNIKALTCTFPAGAQGTWATDGSITARIRQGGPLTVKVERMDPQDGVAAITAPTQADALVQLYGWNLHVMEPSRSGRMLMLTVFGRESKDGKLKATYTRTDYLPVDLPGFKSEPESAQYYGECEVMR